MAEGSGKPPSDEQAMLRQWSSMVGLGVEFVASLIVPGAVGYWVDRKWETGPWGLLIGGGIGFAVGLYSLIRAGNRMMKK